MNRERLLGIAQWLDGGAVHDKITFNMDDGIVIHEAREFDATQVAQCQTSCCIAGAAVQFYDHPERMKLRREYGTEFGRGIGNTRSIAGALDFHPGANIAIAWHDISEEAKTLLDLTEYEGDSLFAPGAHRSRYCSTPWVAAAVIRHFVATGVVDWHAEHIRKRAAEQGLIDY